MFVRRVYLWCSGGMHKKMRLRTETVRVLVNAVLREAAGGLPTSGPVPNSNLTCGVGCKTIYCDTNYVSCPVDCPLR